MQNETQQNDNSQVEDQDSDNTFNGFAPNEFIGYRIQPDENNWTVGKVRKYGPSNKKAGQEYFTPIAYCRTLECAAKNIVDRDSRMQSYTHDLVEAMAMAKQSSIDAVISLEKRLLSGEVTLPNKAKISDRVTLPITE